MYHHNYTTSSYGFWIWILNLFSTSRSRGPYSDFNVSPGLYASRPVSLYLALKRCSISWPAKCRPRINTKPRLTFVWISQSTVPRQLGMTASCSFLWARSTRASNSRALWRPPLSHEHGVEEVERYLNVIGIDWKRQTSDMTAEGVLTQCSVAMKLGYLLGRIRSIHLEKVEREETHDLPFMWGVMYCTYDSVPSAGCCVS